jgi:hypothetical protein
LRTLRKEFYDGLVQDLMRHKNYTLAEIVMAEKVKEKFALGVKDEITGLHVYAAQKKWTEYKEKFDIFFNDTLEEEFRLNYDISQILG